jgi:hypothetical protein
MHNYTAPDVNMLHIAVSSAENNKIKGIGVDFISTLLLPSKNSTPVPLVRYVMPAPKISKCETCQRQHLGHTGLWRFAEMAVSSACWNVCF